MPYVATINSDSAEALNLVNYLKTFKFIDITEQKSTTKRKSQTALAEPFEFTPKEKELQKSINQSLKELDDFRAGKVQFKELNDFLNEL